MFLRREKILALFSGNSVKVDIKRTSLTFLNKVFEDKYHYANPY